VLSSITPENPVVSENPISVVLEPEAVIPPPVLSLTKVRLISPGVQIGADEVEKNGNIVFRWSSSSNANAYIWELTGANSKKSDTVRGTSYSIEASKIDNGVYLWKVESVRIVNGKIVQRGEVVERGVIVNIPEPPKPILNKPLETP
jgi:hypothetical protein